MASLAVQDTHRNADMVQTKEFPLFYGHYCRIEMAHRSLRQRPACYKISGRKWLETMSEQGLSLMLIYALVSMYPGECLLKCEHSGDRRTDECDHCRYT